MFMGEYNSGGIVGVLAKELSRDEIFYGIKERRYMGATSPDRILIEFTINGKGLVNNSEITLPNLFTYTGHPPSAAAAIKTISFIEKMNIVNNADNVSNSLIASLKNIQMKFPEIIQEVRGQGLMIGVEINISKDPLACKLFSTQRSGKYHLICN